MRKSFSFFQPKSLQPSGHGDPSRAAETLKRARAALSQGDIEAALSMAQTAVDQYQGTRDREGLGHAHDLLGEILMQMDHFEVAAQHFQEAANQFLLPQNDAETFVKLAEASHYRGELDKAIAAYRQAVTLYNRLNEPAEALLVTCRLGYVLYQQQNWEEAEKVYRSALDKASDLGLEEIVENSLLEIGNALARQGRIEEAKQILKQVVARARADESLAILADALHSLAYTYSQDGQRERASEVYQESLRLKQSLRDRLSVADTMYELGINEGERGSRVQARHWLEQAAQIYKELNRTEQLEITRSVLDRY